MLKTNDSHFRLVAFRRSLDEQFAATCEVGRASAIPDRPPVTVTDVMVGVSYEPLRRLSPLLALFEIDVLHEQAWPESAGSSDRDRVNSSLKITTDEEIDAAAQQLAGVIIRHAVPYAEQHADVDGLIAQFSGIEGDHARLAAAALQAASGRFDDARLALTQLGPPDLASDAAHNLRWRSFSSPANTRNFSPIAASSITTPLSRPRKQILQTY